MLDRRKAHHLRNLITRHAWTQYLVGRMVAKDAPEAEQHRIHAAADAAARALCAELETLTEDEEHENYEFL